MIKTEAFASGGAAFVAQTLGVIACARGMTEVAKSAGVSREALDKSLSEDGDLRLTTLLGVTRVLGITLSVQVAPAG
jgi:probable addiction module antidote protein